MFEDEMSVADAARELNVHPNTVRNWVKSGKLQARRLPPGPTRTGWRRILRSSVEAVKENRTRDMANVQPMVVTPEQFRDGYIVAIGLDRTSLYRDELFPRYPRKEHRRYKIIKRLDDGNYLVENVWKTVTILWRHHIEPTS